FSLLFSVPNVILCYLFFFTVSAPTLILTLSLHDALPISIARHRDARRRDDGSDSTEHDHPDQEDGNLLDGGRQPDAGGDPRASGDRKSTRLNSSHQIISYAVFCLKKKKPKRSN